MGRPQTRKRVFLDQLVSDVDVLGLQGVRGLPGDLPDSQRDAGTLGWSGCQGEQARMELTCAFVDEIDDMRRN